MAETKDTDSLRGKTIDYKEKSVIFQTNSVEMFLSTPWGQTFSVWSCEETFFFFCCFYLVCGRFLWQLAVVCILNVPPRLTCSQGDAIGRQWNLYEVGPARSLGWMSHPSGKQFAPYLFLTWRLKSWVWSQSGNTINSKLNKLFLCVN